MRRLCPRWERPCSGGCVWKRVAHRRGRGMWERRSGTKADLRSGVTVVAGSNGIREVCRWLEFAKVFWRVRIKALIPVGAVVVWWDVGEGTWRAFWLRLSGGALRYNVAEGKVVEGEVGKRRSWRWVMIVWIGKALLGVLLLAATCAC